MAVRIQTGIDGGNSKWLFASSTHTTQRSFGCALNLFCSQESVGGPLERDTYINASTIVRPVLGDANFCFPSGP